MTSVGLPAWLTTQPRDLSLLGQIDAPEICMRHVVVSLSRNGGGFGRGAVKLGNVSILEELPTARQLRFGVTRAGSGRARGFVGGC